MKNLWMLAALLSLTLGVKANHYGAAIVIKSKGNVPILVKMDRQRSPQPRAVHNFTGIRPGSHFVEIFRTSPHYNHGGHRPAVLLYRGYIRAQQGFKTVYSLNHGNLRISSKKPLAHGYPQQGCSIHGQQHCSCPTVGPQWYNGYGNGYGGGQGNQGHGGNHGNGQWNGNQGGCSGSCNGSCGQPHGNNWNNWNNNYGYGGQQWGGGYGQYGHSPMSYPDFWSFMNRMRKNVTDAQKVEMAKRELKDSWLTTEQVNIVLDDLFFEQHKLDIAKDLYHRTIDPDQYKDLDSQFQFSSNREALSKYVERNSGN